jgi:lysylphosphatidylglycerol synthetase-like protein (DUF2156 family)
MTTVARTATVPGRPDLIRRRITGTPTEVAATVAMLADTGRLVAATTPRQLDPRDPSVTVIVTARLRPTITAPAPARSRARWVKPTVIVTASAAALAATGYGLMVLTRTVVQQTAAHWPGIVGVLVIVALVLIGLGRTTGCPGLHCFGCRDH